MVLRQQMAQMGYFNELPATPHVPPSDRPGPSSAPPQRPKPQCPKSQRPKPQRPNPRRRLPASMINSAQGVPLPENRGSTDVPRLDGAAASFEPPSGSTQLTLGAPEQPGRVQTSDEEEELRAFKASVADDTEYEVNDDAFIPLIIEAERDRHREYCLRHGLHPPPIETPHMGLIPPLTAEDLEFRRLLRPPSPPRDPRRPPPLFPRPPPGK
jgi:hypothetical protein